MRQSGISREILGSAFAVVLLTLLLTMIACGVHPHSAAGVVAICKVQGETLVLLADHVDSDRGWGTFGGRRIHGESVAMTASREFREETRCMFTVPTKADLEGKPKVGNPGFWSFVVEVPFVPIENFTGARAPGDCQGPEYKERSPWAWIPLDELIQVLENPGPNGEFHLKESSLPPGSRTRLWGASAKILQTAHDKGLFD